MSPRNSLVAMINASSKSICPQNLENGNIYHIPRLYLYGYCFKTINNENYSSVLHNTICVGHKSQE